MNNEEIKSLIERGETILQFKPKCFDYDNMFVPAVDSYRANNGQTIYDGLSSRFFFEMAKEWIADCSVFLKKNGIVNEFVDTSIYSDDRVVYYKQEVSKYISQLRSL